MKTNSSVYTKLWLSLRRSVVARVIVAFPYWEEHKNTLLCSLPEGDTLVEKLNANWVSKLSKDPEGTLTVICPAIGKCIDLYLSKTRGSGSASDWVSAFASCGYNYSEVHNLTGGLVTTFYYLHSTVRPDSDLEAGMVLRWLRQLLLAFYKLELPYSESSQNSVISRFVDNDDICAFTNELITHRTRSGPLDLLLRCARTIVTRCVGRCDPREIIPSHGPGAVATGERAWEKSLFKRMYATLNAYYPFDEYFMYSLTHVVDEPGLLDQLIPLSEGTSKVVLVPKDSRGPRLIACEPLEYQWIQQGLAKLIMSTLEKRWNWSHNRVNFTDQMINRRLAKAASRDAGMATLDMKDASDLVSTSLVRELFRGTRLCEAIFAARSSNTLLPSGKTMKLQKYASMGSALCFPVESLCFYALSVAAVHLYGGVRLAQARDLVYVYGDDIVVDSKHSESVIQALECAGLTVNIEKSCTGTSFRESCGFDAYLGINVTPIRFKRPLCRSQNAKMSPGCLLSWVDYCNRLWIAGYGEAAMIIAEYLNNQKEVTFYVAPHCGSQDPFEEDDLFKGYQPLGTVLIFDASTRGVQPARTRWNKKLHRMQVRSYTASVPEKSGASTGWRTMLERLTPNPHASQPGMYPYVWGMRLKQTWLSC